MNVTIPPNTTATVFVPAAQARDVSEGGKPATRSAGLKFLRLERGRAVFAAEPGSYSFTVDRRQPRG
jgi:alpha-L-rhamnosidase